MTTHETKCKIIEALKKGIADLTDISVLDQTHKHVNHAGSQPGQGHYHVNITSQHLASMPKLNSHRLIYQLLSELLPTKIHALAISIKAS